MRGMRRLKQVLFPVFIVVCISAAAGAVYAANKDTAASGTTAYVENSETVVTDSDAIEAENGEDGTLSVAEISAQLQMTENTAESQGTVSTAFENAAFDWADPDARGVIFTAVVLIVALTFGRTGESPDDEGKFRAG
jgi:hypothetical protein